MPLFFLLFTFLKYQQRPLFCMQVAAAALLFYLSTVAISDSAADFLPNSGSGSAAAFQVAGAQLWM